MSSIKWVHSSPLNSPEALADFENDYDVVLPSAFKAFITVNNYAAPLPDTVTIKGFGDTDVKRLLSFNRADTETVYQVIDYFIKKSIVPFASDSYGNYFCLSGETVVFWEHETGVRYDLQWTFDEFLEFMH